MKITKQRFIDINKYALIAAIAQYLIGTFVTHVIQVGVFLAMAAGFYSLLHVKYFRGRPRLAAHVWLVPVFIASLTYPLLMEAEPSGQNLAYFLVVLAGSLIPFLLLITGKSSSKPSRKPRLRVVNARILVQVAAIIAYAVATSMGFIHDSKSWLIYWAVFHILTTAILPFVVGRALCGWLCPTATLQDGLFKYLTFPRPIPKLPKAIEEQSRSSAMYLSGTIDKDAPFLPFTLLVAWFPMFFAETVFDLTTQIWYPIFFMYGLFLLSLLFPWRKMCTHFCWLSSYRGLAAHNSLWRIRFNKSACEDCKKCMPEKVCPFYIDITKQDNEMPATCCLCFSCMEACPFPGVITYRRAEKEKARLRKGLS